MQNTSNITKNLLKRYTNYSLNTVDNIGKAHQEEAMKFFDSFAKQVLDNLKSELDSIKNILNLELGRTINKLKTKISQNGYEQSLKSPISNFYLQSFVRKEIKQIDAGIYSLKMRVYEYIEEFCTSFLNANIKKSNDLSLFHRQNKINSQYSDWWSVTSRGELTRAEIRVHGFQRPSTTWLALGVSKKKKQYGIVKNTLGKQDFMGNIYLNGSNNFNEGFALKRNLMTGDIFVIECTNRMVWVYRKLEGKSKKEIFILDDDKKYYFYIAMKGPIQLEFQGE